MASSVLPGVRHAPTRVFSSGRAAVKRRGRSSFESFASRYELGSWEDSKHAAHSPCKTGLQVLCLPSSPFSLFRFFSCSLYSLPFLFSLRFLLFAHQRTFSSFSLRVKGNLWKNLKTRETRPGGCLCVGENGSLTAAGEDGRVARGGEMDRRPTEKTLTLCRGRREETPRVFIFLLSESEESLGEVLVSSRALVQTGAEEERRRRGKKKGERKRRFCFTGQRL